MGEPESGRQARGLADLLNHGGGAGHGNPRFTTCVDSKDQQVLVSRTNASRFKDSWIGTSTELQIYKIRESVLVGSREFIHPSRERLKKKKSQQLKNFRINYLGVFSLLPHWSERRNKKRE